MNLIDVVLLVVMFLAVWAGWQRGFILGTINLFVWIGCLLAGFFFYKQTAALLGQWVPALGVWKLPLAFFLVIILSRILLGFIFNRILRITPQNAHQHGANKALGLIPGFINGLIYASIFAAILISVPIADKLSDETRESKLANRFSGSVAWLDDRLAPIFDSAVKQSLNRLTVEPESDETVDLHFKVTDARSRPDLEAQMLQLVNQERTKRGLRPVQPDPELLPVARAHSQDMFARGYFSHYTPEGKDPFDRMKAKGVKYRAAGENLALGQTLRICHEGLMNSPGHRANILNPNYGRLGIGILDGGIRGLMISQEFRN